LKCNLCRYTEVYPTHDVMLGIDSLGKEPLLGAIAAAMGCPVRVTPERAGAAADALAAAEESVAEAAAAGIADWADSLDPATYDAAHAAADGTGARSSYYAAAAAAVAAAPAAASAAAYLGGGAVQVEFSCDP
jgi:hypothetical protein